MNKQNLNIDKYIIRPIKIDEIDNYIQNDLIIHYFQLNNYKKDISSFHLQNKERSYILINKIMIV